jgi:hypothetical protein
VEAGPQRGVLRPAEPALGAPVGPQPTRESLARGLLEALMLRQSEMLCLKLVHGGAPDRVVVVDRDLSRGHVC